MAAGLDKKSNYTKWPDVMCYTRALMRVAREQYNHLLQGAFSHTEFAESVELERVDE